ncbi:hypothetical protein BHM03_00034177 [Ensete ventricosum]|nr:hypothetical protein BHM03_00034177 [Ensete ventricosum]
MGNRFLFSAAHVMHPLRFPNSPFFLCSLPLLPASPRQCIASVDAAASPVASPTFYRLQPHCQSLPPSLLLLPLWPLLPLLYTALLFLHCRRCFPLPSHVNGAPINRLQRTSPIVALIVAAATSSFPYFLRCFPSHAIYAALVSFLHRQRQQPQPSLTGHTPHLPPPMPLLYL